MLPFGGAIVACPGVAASWLYFFNSAKSCWIGSPPVNCETNPPIPDPNAPSASDCCCWYRLLSSSCCWPAFW